MKILLFLLIFIAVVLCTTVLAQSGTKKVIPPPPTRRDVGAKNFNGYDYSPPADQLRLPPPQNNGLENVNSASGFGLNNGGGPPPGPINQGNQGFTGFNSPPQSSSDVFPGSGPGPLPGSGPGPLPGNGPASFSGPSSGDFPPSLPGPSGPPPLGPQNSGPAFDHNIGFGNAQTNTASISHDNGFISQTGITSLKPIGKGVGFNGGPRVQTIRIIHENRARGHIGGGGPSLGHGPAPISNVVKTVRVIHETRGGANNVVNHGVGDAHQGKIRTIKIVHENLLNSFPREEVNEKTIKIVQNGGHSGAESLGRNIVSEQQKTIRIIQENASPAHVDHHSVTESVGGHQKTIRIIQENAANIPSNNFEHSKTVEVVENPTISTHGAYGDLETQTYQTVHDVNPVVHHEPTTALKTIKLVSENSPSTGYSYSAAPTSGAVTYRIVGNAPATPAYTSTYSTDADYRAVKILQEPSAVQYTTIPQAYETYKVISAPAALPQAHEYKTVRLYPDGSPYGSHYGSHYSTLSGADSFYKILQNSGINTGHAGYGKIKFLRLAKK